MATIFIKLFELINVLLTASPVGVYSAFAGPGAIPCIPIDPIPTNRVNKFQIYLRCPYQF